MMLKKNLTFAFLLAVTAAPCWAQSDQPTKTVAIKAVEDSRDPRGEEPAAAKSILDAAEAEYRELICARAVSFEDPNQALAIDLAVAKNFVDPRFDDLIRQAFGEASKPDMWDVERLARVERLLPLCTLSGKQRTELVFRCYMMCTEREDLQLMRRLKQQLSLFPDETSRLVSERMRQDDYTPRLLSLVPIVGKSSESVLPMVLGAARSDDPELAGWALATIPDLIDGLREFEKHQRRTDMLFGTGVDDPELKYLKYAQRLISRYDTDDDSQLSPAEYQKMLMSPAPADTDKDGLITVEEYAVWMLLRSKR